MGLLGGLLGLLMIVGFFCIYSNSYKNVAELKKMSSELADLNEELSGLREDFRLAADAIIQAIKDK